jgi:hypothetical protein
LASVQKITIPAHFRTGKRQQNVNISINPEEIFLPARKCQNTSTGQNHQEITLPCYFVNGIGETSTLAGMKG